MNPSVVFRKGPLTAADYDEAIEGLVAARKAFDEMPGGCPICWDTGHFAESCHHNPLLVARRYTEQRDREHWRCFHCGEVFSIDEPEAAQDHFGRSENEIAKCLTKDTTQNENADE